MIAHKLAIAGDADKVLVMENGAIVEEGIPSQLANAGGRYAQLRRIAGLDP